MKVEKKGENIMGRTKDGMSKKMLMRKRTSLGEKAITLIALVVTMVLHYDKVKKCSNSNSFLLSSI